MSLIFQVMSWLLQIYLLFLVSRLLFDLAINVNRSWRPRGLLLVVAEITMTLTDPPLKLVRRLVPNVRLGMISLDLSFGIVWIIVILARLLLASLS
jgi:YggT family protein